MRGSLHGKFSMLPNSHMSNFISIDNNPLELEKRKKLVRSYVQHRSYDLMSVLQTTMTNFGLGKK